MTYFDTAKRLGFHNQDAIKRSNYRYTKNSKSSKPMTPEDFIQSEAPAPGTVRLSSLVDHLNAPLPFAVERLRRFAESFSYPVTDTIDGYTLPKKDAEALTEWLRTYTPIRPVWESYCKSHKIPVTHAEYHRFLNTIKRKNYAVRKYHPCHLFEEYVSGTEADAMLMIQIIYGGEGETDTLGYMTAKVASSRLGVSESAMEAWLNEHPQWISTVAGVPFIKAADVETLSNEWKQCVDAETYDWLAFRGCLNEDASKLFYNRVMSVIRTNLKDLHLPAKSYPQQNNRKIYFAPDKIYLVELILLFGDYLVPVSAFNNAAYTTGAYLQTAIKEGRLDGAAIKQNYYLRPCQVLDYQAKLEKYIPVEAAVRQNLDHITSDFNADRKPCWDELFRFCNDFDWWGIWHAELDPDDALFETKYSNVYINAEDTFELFHRLDAWLKTYGKKPAEEFQTRLQLHKKAFPVAVKKLEAFFSDSDSRTVSVCEMIDMLFYMLGEKHRDIDKLSKPAFEKMIDRMRSECSIAATTNFTDFLNDAGYFTGKVSFNRSSTQKDISAYPVEAFTVIASAICSPDIWKEQGLIRKAIQEPKYAQLWLYVALHIFSALRSTDYARLQAPILDGDPDDLLMQIESGTFPVEQAQKFSIMFVSLNRFFCMRPNKTADTQNVLPLYFHVPTDCEAQFGTILAIALAHYTRNNRNGNFIIPSTNLMQQKEFFGTPFVEACGNTAFSGRRANKALMQLVSITAQEELSLSPDVAYSLASSLRSHKGGYAKLSDTTYRYLNNSRFSGLDGNYVINHMFQRGSCSFIVDHMLKTYFKDQYQSLPIHLQTEAIKQLGLSAYEVSEIERNVKLALLDTEAAVKGLVSSSAASGVALSNLVTGNAKTRGGGADCLLKALGQPCAKDSYQHCAGCKYELRNKTQYVHYRMEFTRLTQEIKDLKAKIEDLKLQQHLTTTAQERRAIDEQIEMLTRCLNKAEWLRKEVIHPCLVEIGAHIQTFADERILESYNRLQKNLIGRGATNGT